MRPIYLKSEIKTFDLYMLKLRKFKKNIVLQIFIKYINYIDQKYSNLSY